MMATWMNMSITIPTLTHYAHATMSLTILSLILRNEIKTKKKTLKISFEFKNRKQTMNKENQTKKKNKCFETKDEKIRRRTFDLLRINTI